VDDVIASLEVIPNVDKTTIVLNQFPDLHRERVFWRFATDGIPAVGTVDLERGSVLLIRLDLAESMTLEDLFAMYGTPEFLSAIVNTGEARWLALRLLWPSKGIAAGHVEVLLGAAGSPIKVSPRDAVGEVIYFRPEDYEQLLDEKDLFNRDRSSIEDTILPWQGFGVVPQTEFRQ